MKSSVVGAWGSRGTSAPAKVWFDENLGKILETPGKDGAQSCLSLQIGAQGLHKNTWRPFFEVTPKKVFLSLREKICKQETFRQVWGNLGKNSSHLQKLACCYNCVKAPPLPLSPFWKVRRGMPRHASILRRPCAYCFTYTHSLCSLLQATIIMSL